MVAAEACGSLPGAEGTETIFLMEELPGTLAADAQFTGYL